MKKLYRVSVVFDGDRLPLLRHSHLEVIIMTALQFLAALQIKVGWDVLKIRNH